MLGELYDGEFASMEHNGRMDACMSEEISREEIAALLARESMSGDMNREQAIGVITMHREHWRRLMQGNVCSKQEGEESIAAFDVALAALSAEPCEDAISRKAVLDLAYMAGIAALNMGDDYVNEMVILKKDIAALPSVQPIIPRGHWISRSEGGRIKYPWMESNECSECGENGSAAWDYCPHCGADMLEETNHE